jgi:hypothetical protein
VTVGALRGAKIFPLSRCVERATGFSPASVARRLMVAGHPA